MDRDGAQLCARFAYKPSLLRLCGNDEAAKAAYDCIINNRCNSFRKNITSFRVLYPYLKIISEKHNLDIFDYRVVEAYWIGNDLTEGFGNPDFSKFLKYLKRQGTPEEFLNDLKEKLKSDNIQFIPHHSFNVLFVGNIDSISGVDKRLETMNNCLIRTGSILRISDNEALIESAALELVDKKCKFQTRLEKVKTNFEMNPGAGIGKFVAIHWGEVCKVLRYKERVNLDSYNNLLLDTVKI